MPRENWKIKKMPSRRSVYFTEDERIITTRSGNIKIKPKLKSQQGIVGSRKKDIKRRSRFRRP